MYSIAVRKFATPLRELTCHIGSHSVTCHPAEATFSPLPQQKLIRLVIRHRRQSYSISKSTSSRQSRHISLKSVIIYLATDSGDYRRRNSLRRLCMLTGRHIIPPVRLQTGATVSRIATDERTSPTLTTPYTCICYSECVKSGNVYIS